MIAKAKTIAYPKNALNYVMYDKEGQTKGEEIGRHDLAGDTPQEIVSDFGIYQSMNQRADNKTISLVLSPEKEDGQELSNQDFNNLAEKFLEKMQLKDHQWIAYKHTNSDQPHLHIYVNRIDEKGKAYNDQYISNKASRSAEKLANERGMTTAKDKQQARQKFTQKVRSEIKEIADKVLQKGKINSMESFKAGMSDHGVNVREVKNKQGEIQGLRFQYGDNDFKATEIDRKLSYKKLNERLSARQRGKTRERSGDKNKSPQKPRENELRNKKNNRGLNR